MQYSLETCVVTIGSATVTGAAGVDWSGIIQGSFFMREGKVSYQVAAVPTLVGGLWTLQLTAPYADPTEAAAPYVIHTSFDQWGIPILAPGDTETTALFNRAMLTISNLLIRPVDTIFNSTTNLRESIEVTGSGDDRQIAFVNP